MTTVLKPSIRFLLLLILAGMAPAVDAASCEPGALDPTKLAQVYQGGAQHLSELYTISRTAQGGDVEIALQAQGPISSFSEATYLIVDLLKLRSTLVNEHDRTLVDADIRANLQLAGDGFVAAESYLAALSPKTQNLALEKAIEAARLQIADGIAAYGACIKRPPA
jgi:hypothetical protein